MKMIRRCPTRIELKLEDLKEYESIKKEIEEAKKMQVKSTLGNTSLNNSSGTNPIGASLKDRQDIINERIGYCPLVHNAS